MAGERTAKVLKWLVHILVVSSLVTLYVWVFHYLTEYNTPKTELFPWHPFCMGLCFMGFVIEAVIAYQVLPLEHDTQKSVHLLLNTLGFFTSIAGLAIVLRYHQINAFPDFYSLHSWAGLLTLTFFTIQYFSGFYTFWYPRPKDSTRKHFLPYHVFLGFAVLILSGVSVVSGILEKITFLEALVPPAQLGKFAPAAMLGNLTGLLYILTIFATVLFVYVKRASAFRSNFEAINDD